MEELSEPSITDFVTEEEMYFYPDFPPILNEMNYWQEWNLTNPGMFMGSGE